MATNKIDTYVGGGIGTWTNGGYKTPKTTTKTTKTTTKEFDSKGKVKREITVEETTTETIDYWTPSYTYNYSNSTPSDIKYGRSASTELPLE